MRQHQPKGVSLFEHTGSATVPVLLAGILARRTSATLCACTSEMVIMTGGAVLPCWPMSLRLTFLQLFEWRRCHQCADTDH